MFQRAWLWSKKEERLYSKLCIGKVLHLFSGQSLLGDVRVDIDSPLATYHIDLSKGKLPFKNLEFDTIIADPPWAGPKTWDNWIKLMHEIVRVARKRVVFILGNLIFLLPKPFELSKIYVVKKINPQVKLVYVWDRKDGVLSDYFEGVRDRQFAPPHPTERLLMLCKQK